jgi:hypothetical protein
MTCRVCTLLPHYEGEASTRAHITLFCFSLTRACLPLPCLHNADPITRNATNRADVYSRSFMVEAQATICDLAPEQKSSSHAPTPTPDEWPPIAKLLRLTHSTLSLLLRDMHATILPPTHVRTGGEPVQIVEHVLMNASYSPPCTANIKLPSANGRSRNLSQLFTHTKRVQCCFGFCGRQAPALSRGQLGSKDI